MESKHGSGIHLKWYEKELLHSIAREEEALDQNMSNNFLVNCIHQNQKVHPNSSTKAKIGKLSKIPSCNITAKYSKKDTYFTILESRYIFQYFGGYQRCIEIRDVITVSFSFCLNLKNLWIKTEQKLCGCILDTTSKGMNMVHFGQLFILRPK